MCERQARLDELIAECERLRPTVAWREERRPPTAQTLWEFIQHDLTSHGLGEDVRAAQAATTRQRRAGLAGRAGRSARRATGGASGSRRWWKILRAAAGVCRIVVTCRVYAYQNTTGSWKTLPSSRSRRSARSRSSDSSGAGTKPCGEPKAGTRRRRRPKPARSSPPRASLICSSWRSGPCS